MAFDFQQIGYLALATMLGAVLGWERELHEKTAGLRTHMMVCLGSATFTILAAGLASSTIGDEVDPSRAVQGVATGIGFLGAGQILQARGNVRGLTTAAGIWVTGAIGVACGLGEIAVAVAAVALALVILVVVGRIEGWVMQRGSDRHGEANRAAPPDR